MCFSLWCFLFKVSTVSNVMMGILSGSLCKTIFLSLPCGLRTVYYSSWGQKCVKNYLQGEKKRKFSYARRRQGVLGLKSQHSLERVISCAEKERETHEWCRVKWAKAPGSSAGKPGGECICTEDLVLTYFRARQTSAPCCPPSRGKHDRNDTSYSRTLNPSWEKPWHSAFSGLGLD